MKKNKSRNTTLGHFESQVRKQLEAAGLPPDNQPHPEAFATLWAAGYDVERAVAYFQPQVRQFAALAS